MSAGCIQTFSGKSMSITFFELSLIMSKILASSSTCITIGVMPVSVHRASLDVVQYALVILIFVSLSTLLYMFLLHSFSSALIRTGTSYVISGRIAPLYFVCNAL